MTIMEHEKQAFEMPTQRELAFERAAAARVARIELGELTKLAKRYTSDIERFTAEARAFYDVHRATVAKLMAFHADQVEEYLEIAQLGLHCLETAEAFANSRAADAERDLLECTATRVRAVLAVRKRRERELLECTATRVRRPAGQK